MSKLGLKWTNPSEDSRALSTDIEAKCIYTHYLSAGITSTATTISPDPVFRPSSEVWYPDGSVVLVVRDVGFRVYPGILRQQSQRLAEILDESTKPGGTMDDGSVVVWLDYNSAEAVERLLKVMHNPAVQVNETLPFTVLCTLLDVSTHFKVTHIRLSTILALYHFFPPTLEQYWQTKDARRTISIGDVFLAANIARKTNTFSLLVSVLTFCVNQSSEVIHHGVPYSYSSATGNREGYGSGRIELLQENKLAILQARAKFPHLARTITLRDVFFPFPSSLCNRARCIAAKQDVGSKILQGSSIFEDSGFVSPLSEFRGLVESMAVRGSCAECCADMKECVRVGREEVWEKIPGVFGFDGGHSEWRRLVLEDGVNELSGIDSTVGFHAGEEAPAVERNLSKGIARRQRSRPSSQSCVVA
ncbi:hypothetical protein BXZ70DRAFT_954336 [Cristinia sonorae]|uniref:BTB domain-containing protein n=1 Tax=Cristinia sonorae TaxID=1940300 RepID=A0A8K0XLH5_9AGAR|nr:hypothetical protein BXZ70DRAFT_954336 [Cristinia sonorae]